jgi:transcriptional regulator of heat shock response
VKKLEPVKNNDINKVDIDVTDIEREEWKKIVNLLQNKLKEAQTDEEMESIQRDLERAEKRLNDLSSK